MAFRLTLALSGVNEKQAAAAMEKDRTTVNRWCNGKVDTAAVRFRRYLRRLVQGGAFPVAILADVASEIWSQSVRDWTPEEMMARKHDLHRAETEAQGKVDVWQMDDRAGVAPECENQVDAAILEHATRLIELYVLRCELRLGRSS